MSMAVTLVASSAHPAHPVVPAGKLHRAGDRACLLCMLPFTRLLCLSGRAAVADAATLSCPSWLALVAPSCAPFLPYASAGLPPLTNVLRGKLGDRRRQQPGWDVAARCCHAY